MTLSCSNLPIQTLSFAEALEQLWVAKHTGPVIVNMLHGRPMALEIPSEPTRIKLDNTTPLSAN